MSSSVNSADAPTPQTFHHDRILYQTSSTSILFIDPSITRTTTTQIHTTPEVIHATLQQDFESLLPTTPANTPANTPTYFISTTADITGDNPRRRTHLFFIVFVPALSQLVEYAVTLSYFPTKPTKIDIQQIDDATFPTLPGQFVLKIGFLRIDAETEFNSKPIRADIDGDIILQSTTIDPSITTLALSLSTHFDSTDAIDTASLSSSKVHSQSVKTSLISAPSYFKRGVTAKGASFRPFMRPTTFKRSTSPSFKQLSPASTPSTNSSIFSRSFSKSLSTSAAPGPAPERHAQAAFILEHFSKVVTSLHSRFARYKAVDVLTSTHFIAENLKPCKHPSPPAITKHERAAIATAHTLLTTVAECPSVLLPFKRQPTTTNRIAQFSCPSNPSVLHSSTTVDASPAKVFAWFWLHMSYDRTLPYIRKTPPSNLLRTELAVPRTRTKFTATLNCINSKSAPVIFRDVSVFDTPDNDLQHFVVATHPLSDYKPSQSGDEDALSSFNKLTADLASSLPPTLSYTHAGHLSYVVIKQLTPNVSSVAFFGTVEFPADLPPLTSYMNTRHLQQFNARLPHLQNSFLRPAKDVDNETLTHSRRPPHFLDLDGKTRQVFVRCNVLVDNNRLKLALAVDGDRAVGTATVRSTRKRFLGFSQNTTDTIPWTAIPSADYFTTVLANHQVSTDDPSSQLSSPLSTLIKASVVIDCSPKRALAYWLMLSHNSARAGAPPDDIASALRLAAPSPFSFTAARIKKLPFPFTNRAFVDNEYITEDLIGALVYVAEPAPSTTEADYGYHPNAVRGKTLTLLRLDMHNPDDGEQCEATLYQFVDIHNHKPYARSFESAACIAASSVSSLTALRAAFTRDTEIDAAAQATLSKTIDDAHRKRPPIYSAAEAELISSTVELLDSATIDGNSFEPLPSPHSVSLESCNVGSSYCGRATSTIDAPLSDCAAWELSKMSRLRIRHHRVIGGFERELVQVNRQTAIFRVVCPRPAPLFSSREFKMQQSWRWIGEDLVITYTSTETENDKIPEPSHPTVRATISAVVKFEALPSIIASTSIPQTSVTLTVLVDPKLPIPRWRKSVLRSFLRAMVEMQETFDRAGDIDSHNMLVTVAKLDIEPWGDELEEEAAIFAKANERFAFFDKKNLAIKKLRGYETMQDEIASVNSGEGWVKSTITVRGSKTQVLAFMINFTARSRWLRCDVERKVLRKESNHRQVVRVAIEGVSGASENVALWQRVKDRSFLYVEGEMTMKIKEVGETSCRVTWVAHLTTGEGTRFLKFAVKEQLLESLRLSSAMQLCMQSTRGLDDYDGGDGEALGLRLMRGVAVTIRGQKGLQQLSLLFPWLQAFLEETVKGQLTFGTAVKTRLIDLTEAEARTIGCSLSAALRARKSADAGVHQWMLANRSVEELFEKYPWTKGMFTAISQEILKKAPWGLVWRVFTGAGLSILDIITDVQIMLFYLNRPGEEVYGHLLLGMLVASMVIQLMINFVQNLSSPKHLFLDTIFILTAIKPGVDAVRVTMGSEQLEWQLLDPKAVHSASKGAELFCEAIPGCILQCFAYMKLLEGGGGSAQALFSLMVSAATAGFTSASVSYDYDTDPTKRKQKPDFYGVVPAVAWMRTLMLVMMVAMSTLLIVLRGVAVSLLMFVNGNYFLYYMALDVVLYTGYKLGRNDFDYWVPWSGPIGKFLSWGVRVQVKVVTDFTGLIQTRHPGEVGGLMWSLNMCFATLILPNVCLAIYFEDRKETGEGVFVEENKAYLYANMASGCWLICFAVVVSLMDRKYWRTFIDFTSGADFFCDTYFRQGEDDAQRSAILNCNQNIWNRVEDDVKEWVKAGWWTWEEEKPSWFTEAWKKRVPEGWVPEEEAAGGGTVRGNGGGSGRGSSKRGEWLDLLLTGAEEDAAGGAWATLRSKKGSTKRAKAKVEPVQS